ncbi:MAG TPA: hypothetical protein VII60_04475 [Acidimicrobiales bacterium]
MSEESSVVTCPACGSARVTLDGVGKTTGGETLKATCQDCATTWEALTSIQR